MRSYNHLWDHMVDVDNVKACFVDAAKGKTTRRDVRNHLACVDDRAATLIQHLNNEPWTPPVHKPSYLREGSTGKVRIIIKPTYAEQVVHHMLVGELKPIIMRGMYRFCCGSVPGRGIHDAKRAMEKWRDGYKGRKFYVAELDVRKFYHNIDHAILKEKLCKVIRDKRFLELLFIIINTGSFSNNGKGLPLGFYTSQWLANYLLQSMDYFILQTLRPDHYLRYMDNLYLFSTNKKKLHKAVREIDQYLTDQLQLSLNDNWQVYRFEYVDADGRVKGRAINCLGFVLHHNRTTIRKSILLRIRRKANNIDRKGTATWYDAAAVISYIGWFDYTDAYAYYEHWIKPKVCVKTMKMLVARHARKEAMNNGIRMVS